MPRNGAPARSGALPGCAGVPARTSPPRAAPAGERRNPAEGGARDRGLPARTFPLAAALPGRARSLRPSRQRSELSSPADPRNAPQRRPRPLRRASWVRGRLARTSPPRTMPPGRGATPPKAGPGTAGFQPARFRPPRYCREGRSRCAPPANDRNCRAPRIPAMPRNGAPARSGALPGCAGVPARTSPPRTMPPGRGATPPKAGPGTAGFQPARSRAPRCRRGEARSSRRAPRRLRPRAAYGILMASVWRPFPPRSAPS